MHPLIQDFSEYKDSEIVMMLDSFKEELGRRRQASLNKMMENRDKSLDKLVKVN